MKTKRAANTKGTSKRRRRNTRKGKIMLSRRAYETLSESGRIVTMLFAIMETRDGKLDADDLRDAVRVARRGR